MPRDLGRLRVVLVHGALADTVRALATQVVKQAAGDPDDAFAVTLCDAEDREDIRSALWSPAFGAGRRVVRVREAGDRLAPLVVQVLGDDAPGLLVLEAGALAPKSKLRAAVDGHAAGCCLAAASGPAAAGAAVRAVLEARGLHAEADVLALLTAQAEQAGGAPSMVAERAALLAAARDTLSLADVRLLGAEAGSDRLDAGIVAGMGGDPVALDAALAEAAEDGAAGVQMIRAALMASQKARGGLPAWGRSDQDLLERVRRDWSEAALEAAGARLLAAERAAKSTGLPGDLLARQAVLALGLPRGGRG